MKTNYPNGFADGMLLRNASVYNPPGKVFYVGANATPLVGEKGASDGNDGTFYKPFATLDYAIGKCAANRGDIILIRPNHSESLTADSAVDIDIAGVSVIGLGNGEDRPTYTFTTATTADFKIAAANVLVAGLVFKCNIASQAMMIEVTGDDAEIAYCDFREGSATGLNFVTIGVADNDSDRCYVHDCKFYMPTAGNGDSAINVAADMAGVRIENCDIYGDFDLAGIDIPTGGNAQVDCVIKDCHVTNLLTGQHAIQVNGTGSTGKIINVQAVTDAFATSIDAGGLEMFGCFHNVGTDQGGWTPLAPEVIGTFPEPATPADGESLASTISWVSARNSVPAGINPLGSVYYVAASGGSDSATGGGLDPNEPLATIAQAITNASAADTIVLGPGTHSVDVSASALVPLADQRFVAAIPPHGGKPSTIITHDADDGADLVTVDVDGVVFEGIEFLVVAGGTTAIRLFNISQTTAVNGLAFKDCWFNLNSVDAAGITALNVDDATNDTTGLVVQNCRFLGGDATTNQAIYVDIGVGGCTRGLFERNMFECESADADCLALNFADPGASGGSYAFTFRDNDIIGPKDGGGDGTPIVFAGAMTEDEIVPMIRTNYFSGTAATPITQDEVNTGIISNYVGDDATGGTLVDPGT